MKRYIFLLTLIFTSVNLAHSQNDNCVREAECFRLEYLGAVESNKNSYVLTYTIQVNCDTPLEYVAFELPVDGKAATPANIYASDPKYNVYNSRTSGTKIQTDFNAIQFTAKTNTVINNGMTDTLRYYLDAADFAAMGDVRVQAKAGEATALVTFSLTSCGMESILPSPACTLDMGAVVFGFVNAENNEDGTTTVRLLIQNNTAFDVESVAIEAADPALPMAVPTTGASYRGKYKYQVTAGDGLITFSAQNATGFANGLGDLFEFTVPTEAYEAEPFFTIAVATSETTVTTGFNTGTCEDAPIIPLPVELISFKGKATQNGIELTWSTASETDNDRFEVESSRDARVFTAIGTVKGAGTSSMVQHYTFQAKAHETGTHYFRIRQVDFDGTSETSKVIAVENRNDMAAAPGIVVYPNPASGSEITIALPKPVSEQGAQVRISDMNGRVLHTQRLASGDFRARISLPALLMRKGIYMVSLQTSEGVETQKLYVQ